MVRQQHPAVRVEQLSKTYISSKRDPGIMNAIKGVFHRKKTETRAVHDISFQIMPGEIVGFLGPNGAGKTTTLKMLSGILYPTAGSIDVLGYTPWHRERDFQKQFALVMGNKNQLWWDLPAMESFLLNKDIYGVPTDRFDHTIAELTKLLRIENLLNIPVRKLSLGERMKCELVAALLHNPKVLFLDEPTLGLDVVSQNTIREFLKKYNKSHTITILLTSHYMEDIEALSQRVIIMNRGEIGYDGSLAALKARYIDAKELVVTFTEDVFKRQLSVFGKVKDWSSRRVVLEVPKAEAKHVAAGILADFPVDDILINEPAVDDVIRRVFQEGQYV